MLNKYKNGTLNFVPSCSYGLLSSQADTIYEYLTTLEKRAEIENVSLEEVK